MPSCGSQCFPCWTFETGNGDRMGSVPQCEAAGVAAAMPGIVSNPGICSLNTFPPFLFRSQCL